MHSPMAQRIAAQEQVLSAILKQPRARCDEEQFGSLSSASGVLRILIRAVGTPTLRVPMAGPRNDPGVACETRFMIVMRGG